MGNDDMGMEQPNEIAKCTQQTTIYDEITRIYRINGYSWLDAQCEADRIIEEKRARDLGGEQLK